MPVDLRWGLTKEDTSATGLGAIEYCLREVDASRPFFLMMEGERYGWVPPEYKVSDRQEFEWVKQYPLGHAITEMELLHGFLRKPYTPVHAVAVMDKSTVLSWGDTTRSVLKFVKLFKRSA